ncbi:MAG: hypothetical protein AB1644_00485 [Candidatus Zixiibacteriota bacterium]
MSLSLPATFCWTKIQAEAGDPLDEIIRRKEIERQAGSGLFFWGIGNSLGSKVLPIVSGEVSVVVFSKMPSKPKAMDSDPDSVALWLKYRDHSGNLADIPEHVVLKSRAFAGGGAKKKHYALVCSADTPLKIASLGMFDIGDYRNWGSSNPQIGSSQVTSVVELSDINKNLVVPRKQYQINMVAKLVAPFFVTLCDPVSLTREEVQSLRSICTDSPSTSNYVSKLRAFRDALVYDATRRH